MICVRSLTWQIDVHRHCRNRRFTNIWGGSRPAPGADRLARPARLSELILADVNSQSGERGFARVANASRDTCPRFALAEACRHPPVLGAMVKRGAQLGGGTFLADL